MYIFMGMLCGRKKKFNKNNFICKQTRNAMLKVCKELLLEIQYFQVNHKLKEKEIKNFRSDFSLSLLQKLQNKSKYDKSSYHLCKIVASKVEICFLVVLSIFFPLAIKFANQFLSHGIMKCIFHLEETSLNVIFVLYSKIILFRFEFIDYLKFWQYLTYFNNKEIKTLKICFY